MRGSIYMTGRKTALAAGLLCAFSLVASCQAPSQQAYIEGAAAAGNPDAKTVLAAQRVDEALEQRRDPSAPLAEILALAEAGHVRAQVYYGEFHLYGAKGYERDLDKARLWLQKAADKKDPAALADLAYIYGYGAGVPSDGAKALTYARAAADLGDADGQVALGECYAKGWGVAKDQKAALQWYHKAANQNEAVGMRAIGTAYREGEGVSADKVMALAWFILANRHATSYSEQTEAARLRDEIAIVMLPDEHNQSRNLVAKWKPGSDLIAERQNLQPSTGTTPAAVTASARENVSYITTATTANMAAPKVQDNDIALRNLKSSMNFVVSGDGSYTLTSHSQLRILKDAAVAEASQVPVRYSATFDQLEIVEAYTLKADGSRLQVSPSAIYEQPVPNVPTAPTFNDQRMKVIVFPNVAVGDTLVTTTKTVSKPMLPGLFSLSYYFPRTYAMNDFRITVSAPASMPLATDSHGLDFKIRTSGDTSTYEWVYRNPKPLVEQLIALDPFDRLPRLFASSYSGYEQFAKVYAEAIESKSVITPKLQKLADEITAGTTDKRKQAALLHDWVSRNIRYVAVALGLDAIIPHEATAIYEAGYGDCKDQSTLLVTLLKAKGIDAEIALINLGNSYTLPNPPTFGTLNHAITYIPSFDLYTDTTASTAEFGVLPFGEYGKPVIIATKSGQVVRRTPVLRTAGATLTATTISTMNKDAVISGQTTIDASGPFAGDLRGVARQIQASGSEQMAKQYLASIKTDGEGNFQFAPPNSNGRTYSVSGTFKLMRSPEILAGNSFALPGGLNFATRPGDVLLGPIEFMDINGDEPTACYGGKVVEVRTMTLPAGKKPREIPKPFTIKNRVLQYSSVWTLTGNKVTNRREFVSLVDQPVCIGETRRIAAGAVNDIRGDYSTAISLINQ